MAISVKNRKQIDLALLEELDELIMEGWSSDLTIGDVLDSAPGAIRGLFDRLKIASTPVNDGSGTYTVTFKI